MVIKSINSNELLENLILVINSKDSKTLYKGWIQFEYYEAVCMPSFKPNHSL